MNVGKDRKLYYIGIAGSFCETMGVNHRLLCLVASQQQHSRTVVVFREDLSLLMLGGGFIPSHSFMCIMYYVFRY